jgi:CRISPR/Cas system-associated protein endoribonuclease Cas2
MGEMMSLVQLVYHSRMTDTKPGLSRLANFRLIHATAMKVNRLNGISGFLIFTASNFVQVLEGARDAVEETYERIKRDPRHCDITLVGIEPKQFRSFSNWLMGAMNNDVDIQEAMLSAGLGNSTDLTRLNAKQIVAVCSALAEKAERKAA